jgi:hypothetical protein
MIRSPLALIAASLLGAAVLGGCGGGSKSTSQNTSAPPATTTAATSATGTTGTSTSGVLTYQQAVETCQHDIHAAAGQLVEGTGLEGTCGRVVKNGATMAEVKKAILGLCESALKPAPGEEKPQATLKEHALAVCRNSTK